MQLTKEQRIFIVLEYETTKNCEQVRSAFIETFPERNSPDKKNAYRTHNLGNVRGHLPVAYGLIPRTAMRARKKKETTPAKGPPTKKKRTSHDEPS
ncbi:Protein of unknown function DUF4817 [Trinorchestia longiramus]|nr:Protein of unknown function DUF4817 [Trinorchestia longiramus]